jgi:hypothetical protein
MHARRFSLYEPADFIASHLKDKLEWRPVRDSVALHVPCSSKKLGTTSAFEQIAALCAREVTPSGVPCCGARPSLIWRPPHAMSPHAPWHARMPHVHDVMCAAGHCSRCIPPLRAH